MEDSPHFAIRKKSRQKKNFEKITQTAMWFGYSPFISDWAAELSRQPCRFAFRLLSGSISGLVGPRSADERAALIIASDG